MFFSNLTAGDGTLGIIPPVFDDFPANTTGTSTTTVTTRPPNWLSVFNTSAALASQAIGAWGRNPTTQVGSGNVFAIGGGGGYPVNYAAGQNYAVPGGASMGLGGSVGSTIGGGLDGVFNWMAANPLLVGGFALGAYLLFREPPRRR